MDSEKLTYIEEAGLMFEQLGMTRMVGRVLACLLVSDQDQMSFEEIREILDASKGSVSSCSRQLIQIGLIEPVSLPGDRKTYYRATKVELGSLLKRRMELFARLGSTFDRAASLKERHDETYDWLREAAAFYNWIGGEMDDVINRWHREKRQVMDTHNKKKETHHVTTKRQEETNTD